MDFIKTYKQMIYKCIVLLLMFGFPHLPAFGAMTSLGMNVLGVFLGAIFGWITIDLLWSSMLGVIALGLCGIYNSLGDCFAACFGSQTALLLLGSLFVCALVTVTDLSSFIVRYFMSLSITRKSPFVMVFFIFLASWLVATLSHCIVAAVLMLSIYRSLAKTGEIPEQSPVNSYMLVGITLSCMFGDLTFPFRPISYAILNIYTAFAGAEIPFTGYMIICMPFLAFMLAAYTLAGKLMGVDLSFLQNASLTSTKPVASAEQKAALWCLILMLISMMIPSMTASSTNPVFVFINRLGYGGITIAWILFMMFWEVNGKPLMNLQELSKNFQWGVYLCVCLLIPLANAISSDSVGVSATLNGWLSPLLSAMQPMLFLISVVVLSIILTNLLNNMVVAMIFITLLFSLQDCLGSLNMIATVLSIMLASYVACATPAASPLNAFMYGQRDLVSFRNQMLQGIKTCILLAVLIVAVFYPLACLVF